MNEIVTNINKFVDAMIASKEQLQNVEIQVSKREKEIENSINQLDLNIKKILEDNKKGSDIEKINEIFDKTSDTLSTYFKNAFYKIEEAKKGMSFIQNFEKCFIVSVFGKVKSGKSSIGNFVMGNDLKKYGIKSSYDKLGKIPVQVYDRGKMKEQESLNVLEEGFKEGSTETTSTIQWFELGGLSWFDTPGIGSITIENENLAKEYVKNSDLVIFTCNSDAAGTKQEFEEMKQLFSMGKTVLLLITMSDTYEEDEDDEGEIIQILVAKSDKDRKDVEDYMYETLAENNITEILNNKSILTVSAKLAKEAIKDNDFDKYKSSNMQELLDLLVDITINESAQLKLNTPKQRINSLIDELTTDNYDLLKHEISLNNVKNAFDQEIKSILEKKEELNIDKEMLLEDIKSTCNYKVEIEIDKFRSIIENNKTKISSQEINKKIIEVVSNIVEEKTIKYLEDYIEEIDKSAFSSLKDIAITVDDMEMKQGSVSYEQTRVIRRPRSPKGIFEKAGAFFLKKQYFDITTKTETKYSYFDIGINDSEITRKIIAQLDDALNSSVKDIIDELVKGYFEPMQNLSKNINNLIDNTILELKNMRIN